MKFIGCIWFFLLCRILTAQNTFSYYYPFDGPASTFRSLLIDRDTVLLQGIFIDPTPPYLQGMAFAKVDSNGYLISYQRYFDPKGRDLTYPPLNNMIKLSDGRYLTVGISLQDDALLLIFLSPQFLVDTVFEYFANDPSVQVNYIRSVFELNDGFMIFGGAQRLSYANDGQIFRIKKDGELLWRKWYGLHNKDEAFGDVTWYTDSTFLVASFHKPFPVSSDNKLRNTWIFEVNLEGKILKEFVDPDNYSGTSGGLVVDEEKNIYYTGSSIIEGMYGQHNALGRIGKLNSNFELEWKLNFGKNFNLSTGFIDMILSRDKLITVGSHVDSSRTFWGTPNGYSVGWTGISDIMGDSICEVFDTAHWFVNYGRAMGIFRMLDTLSSGNIIACGEGWFGQQEDTYNEFAWLVKMPNPPCERLTVGNTEIENELNAWKIIPNPAMGSALIQCNQSVFSETTLFYVFDNLGRMVKRFIAEFGDDNVEIDLRNLNEGMYIIQSINNKGHLTGIEKLMIVK